MKRNYLDNLIAYMSSLSPRVDIDLVYAFNAYCNEGKLVEVDEYYDESYHFVDVSIYEIKGNKCHITKEQNNKIIDKYTITLNPDYFKFIKEFINQNSIETSRDKIFAYLYSHNCILPHPELVRLYINNLDKIYSIDREVEKNQTLLKKILKRIDDINLKLEVKAYSNVFDSLKVVTKLHSYQFNITSNEYIELRAFVLFKTIPNITNLLTDIHIKERIELYYFLNNPIKVETNVSIFNPFEYKSIPEKNMYIIDFKEGRKGDYLGRHGDDFLLPKELVHNKSVLAGNTVGNDIYKYYALIQLDKTRPTRKPDFRIITKKSIVDITNERLVFNLIED